MNMNLQPTYYDFILHGTKRIELRLNDEKRQQIQINDIITFTNYNESFNAKVIQLLHYNTFEALINDYDIELLADSSMTKQQLINTLNQFYTKDQQQTYGVLGIWIDLV